MSLLDGEESVVLYEVGDNVSDMLLKKIKAYTLDVSHIIKNTSILYSGRG